MPSLLLLCAAILTAAAGPPATSHSSPSVVCIAPAQAEAAELTARLCTAVENILRGRLAPAPDPAPLLVEVLAQRREGFDARLGWRGPDATQWGPVLSSSSIDARGIAPGAVESLAAALLKVTPVPAAILPPAR
ncbi:hypothetical protein GI374_10025 [Paracoccus sp. S-4012]|uniref:hypothetical protein n=1 Tax=Paracoccus sp. S-4012 TaxID=2665648 RepID=UPI0012AEEEDE|nr:hypothetical protein [Paracoccus sp. S-4012]MRX50777.1 hypothetical protein [Paracoccus sp. S-4012]